MTSITPATAEPVLYPIFFPVDRRQSVRIGTEGLFRAELVTQGVIVRLMDLGGGGCCVASPVALKVGDWCHVRLALGGNDSAIDLPARVVHTHRRHRWVGDRSECFSGLAFLPPEANTFQPLLLALTNRMRAVLRELAEDPEERGCLQ